LLVLFVLLGLIIIALLAFLIYRSFQGGEVLPLEARGGEVQTEQAPDSAAASAASPAASPEAASGETDTAAAAASDSVTEESGSSQPIAESGGGGGSGVGDETAASATDTLGGTWYWIKWGDTLWDLSHTFYRTPWLYGKIAKENNIKNPDLIYANSKIYIPED
jgi:nucleoid-associated protein YgaU